jgi:carboxyl-terminal processing protease
MERRGLRPGLGIVAVIAAFVGLWPRGPSDEPPSIGPSAPEQSLPPAREGRPELDEATDASSLCSARPLRVPSGAPPRLSCAEARAILRDVHARFAVDSPGPKLAGFAELLIGWLDPHGLWSAAPDAPTRRELREHAASLLSELRELPEDAPCATAERSGVELAHWIEELASIYDVGTRSKLDGARARAHAHAIEPIFEDDPVTLPARVLARSLGERLARLERAYPSLGPGLVGLSRTRYFPKLDPHGWSEAVLSAAVRAYVAALDPHGAWTPLDEEWSLYADEPGFETGSRLWGRVTRSAAGVRVVDDPVAPLSVGDLVLSIDGLQIVGMPLEQVEQLARLEPAANGTRRALVLRSGDAAPRALTVRVGSEDDPSDSMPHLESGRVRYGNGDALVVELPNVADGMEEAFARLLDETSEAGVSGILIDLRGNGGGSTDAALGVINLFLPGAPVFPLAAHGEVVEVMRATASQPVRHWRGPVATLVDGHTASAAEMIAGSLAAYARGPVVGARTFGKGCIQEYTDDPTGRGVLRLTSLLFALPDGSPLQGIGITPSLPLHLPKADVREASVPGALPSYSGPDVRAPRSFVAPAWPSHGQRVGPCRDPVQCAALARLGDREARRPPWSRRARRN